jgi:hypothetical protein
MRRTVLVAILLSTLTLAAAIPRVFGLSKPAFAIPDGWTLDREVHYPGNFGVHDNKGSGSLAYLAEDNNTFVMINYEDSLGTAYSNESLTNQALAILQTYQNASKLTEGTMTVAGVATGYAKNFFPEYNGNYLELVFVKGNYFFNVFVGYYGGSPIADEAMSIVDSINVNASQNGLPLEIYLLGVIVAASILMIVLIVRTAKNL